MRENQHENIIINDTATLHSIAKQWQEFEKLLKETLQMADVELLAIQRIMRNLQPLTMEEKLRVVKYVYDRTVSENSSEEGDDEND